MPDIANNELKSARCHYVDWLRVGAVFLLFTFHTARIFDPWENFYVQNGVLSPILTYIFIWFASPWHMALFFLLAGAATYFALSFRSPGEYRAERFKRLLVPFIFGLFAVVPPQSYLGLVSHSGYTGSFWQWYPNFFELNFDDEDGYFLGGHTWGHLWFIVHLFVYSLAALPFFIYLKSGAGKQLISRMAAIFAKPAIIFLFVPLNMAMSQNFPEIAGGNPLFYLLFFAAGFVLTADARFLGAADKYRQLFLYLGFVPLIAIISLYATGAEFIINAGIIDVYAGGFVPWFSIMALLTYGRRWLNFDNRFLRYFNAAAYPLYILHQTVIIAVGFWAVKLAIPVWGKFLLITLISFAVCVGIYEILIRRNNAMRFLFGMRQLGRI